MAATTQNPSANDANDPTDPTEQDTPTPEEMSADHHASTSEGKPLYALAGAADTAVGFLRGLPTRLVDAATDPSLRDQVRAKVGELPEDAKTWGPRVNEMVEQLPAKTHEFPGRVSEFIANASHEAGTAYDDLAIRGEGAVAKWRGEYGPKVDDIMGTVKSGVSQATEGAGGAVTSLRGRAADVADDVAGVITGTHDADAETETDTRTDTDQRGSA